MKIAIVGLRFGQTHHVARACQGVADLKFVSANTAEITYPDADAVILMTKFIQHRWTQVAYRDFSRDRVHLHPGGISKLVRLIKRIAIGSGIVEQRQT